MSPRRETRRTRPAGFAPPVPVRTPRAPWGAVAVAVAPVRRRPDHASEQVNQLLFGELARVSGRSRDGKWLRVRSGDGYAGWVRGWSLAMGDARAAAAWQRAARWQVAVPFWDTGWPGVGALPLGARLARARRGGGWLGPCGPFAGPGTGARGTGARAVRRADRLWPRVAGARAGAAVVRAARRWLGAPYQWGGRTAAGMDCSGLSQWAALASGVRLPRDARLQCAALGGPGSLLPLTRALRGGGRGESSGGPRPGDLWFFGPRPREVTHVAVSRGHLELIHAYGTVCLGSLDPGSPRFEPELFTSVLGFARLPRGGRAPKFA